MDLREAFSSAEIIRDGNNTPKGSHTYMWYGWQIRKRYVDMISSVLEWLWYEEWNFSDLISPEDFDTMNQGVMDISGKSMYIDDKTRKWNIETRQVMAPTHEIPVYAALRDQVTYATDLPLRFFHTWSAYRRPKNYPFPFSLWERRSFIEAHGIFRDSDTAFSQVPELRDMVTHLIGECLDMPYVENDRPLHTNNPVSRYTLCHDIILPEFQRTQIAGMIYFHDDIFATPFWVRYRSSDDNYKTSHIPSGLHFGFSDNLLLGTLVNSYIQEQRRFQLPDVLLPYHVVVLVEQWAPDHKVEQVTEQLSQQGLRFRVVVSEWKSDKKRKYKRLFLQGSPVIVGVNHDGRISFNIGDKNEMIPSISLSDIENLWEEALSLRKELRKQRQQETYNKVLVDGTQLSMEQINKELSQWKVVQIYLKQDNEVVDKIEDVMTWGEILWFHTRDSSWICFYTGEQVSTVASLSRRF